MKVEGISNCSVSSLKAPINHIPGVGHPLCAQGQVVVCHLIDLIGPGTRDHKVDANPPGIAPWWFGQWHHGSEVGRPCSLSSKCRAAKRLPRIAWRHPNSPVIGGLLEVVGEERWWCKW